MAGEKTEKATPKKRKDERKKGNVFVSKDAVTAVSLITSFYEKIYKSCRNKRNFCRK